MSPPHTITVNKGEWPYAAAESTKGFDLSVVSEVNRAVRGRRPRLGCLRFCDVNPVNPDHLLIIPKIHGVGLADLDGRGRPGAGIGPGPAA